MKKKTIISILAGIIVIASASTIAPGRGLIGPAQVPDLKPQPNGNPSGLHLDFGWPPALAKRISQEEGPMRCDSCGRSDGMLHTREWINAKMNARPSQPKKKFLS